MRASVQAGVGSAGASDVKANFERLGWGPVPNPEHDLGTDLLVQARDDRLFDRCAIIGVQVKAGASWFTDVVRDDDGELIGWSYYEPDTAHFDDWVLHGLPHLLVLHELDTRVSYWVHVTATAITVTGKGCKIVVPRGQVVHEEHRDALLEVAAQHRKPIALEGTVRTARVRDIAPGRRLRYALLVPRLVTPRRGQGDGGVEPEEAIALLVQGRLRDLDHIVGQGDSGSWWSEAASSRDWRWRFAAAIRGFLTGADNVDLATHAADAPGPAQRTAATVVAACALMDRECFDDAAASLTAAIDEASPVDHAWLLVQRARAHAQVGDVKGARADAVDAQRALVGDPDDLTASAIGGAAAWLLFETAAWRDQNADEVLRASDTAVSWWRTQTLSMGLTAAVEHRYREWADDQATRIEFEDVVNNNLYAASWNAHLSGDPGTWRAVSSLLARNTLVAGDPGRSVDALDELRRCGDHKSLGQAARKLWSDGPLRVLADAGAATTDKPWSHTSARATMLMWQHAGDVLDTDHADAAARRCLDVLGDILDFERRLSPSFDVPSAATDALFGLMHAASDDVHRDVVDYLVSLPPLDDQANARKVARVASRVRSDALSPGACDAVRDAARLQPDAVLTAQMLGLIADIDDAAKEELLTRTGRGDWDALAAIGNVRRLTDDVARQVIGKSADAVARLIPKPGSGFSSSLFSHDPARTLASMNRWFPDHAQWDPHQPAPRRRHRRPRRAEPRARRARRPTRHRMSPPRLQSHPRGRSRVPARLRLLRTDLRPRPWRGHCGGDPAGPAAASAAVLPPHPGARRRPGVGSAPDPRHRVTRDLFRQRIRVGWQDDNMDFPKQPAEALHRSLRLLGGGGPDEMAIRQAAWVARCVVRGEAAPFAPDDLTALAAGLKTTTFERGAVVFRGGSAPSGGAIDLLDLNQLAKTAGIEAV